MKQRFSLVWLCTACLLATSHASAQPAADYPMRPVRMVVPFAQGCTSGLVSRRPACGQDVGAAGFYRVAAVSSESYPSRPVRMVVPFAPGGASDLVARMISPKLSQELGQQIVVDNRGGASGNIGVEMAARATPDGYTILLGNIGTMAINPALYPKFPIRPVRDFIGVTQVVDVPTALAAHPSVPVATVKEFIEYAKARPGKLNFGSAGAGSNGRLEMEFFMRTAGINLVHIPYKGGAGPATTALLGGEVQTAFVTLSSVIAHVKAGKLKVLGVAAPRRVAAAPDTQTMAEAGFPGMTSGSWQGVYVPSGTPRAVVNRLHAVIIRVMSDPAVVKRLNDSGVEVVTSKSPQDFAGFMQHQTEHWAKLVKEVGVVGE
jgi:tripartite-type tricarboxylate transporter receptor subunit TctC